MAILRHLRERWQLKLLALAFSVALWLVVSSGDKDEALFTVPLDLVDRPPGLEVTSAGVESIVVRLEGLRSTLARVRDEDLRAHVSLRDAQPGRFVARILPKNVTVPRGVKVVWLTPSQVRATLEAVPASR